MGLESPVEVDPGSAQTRFLIGRRPVHLFRTRYNTPGPGRRACVRAKDIRRDYSLAGVHRDRFTRLLVTPTLTSLSLLLSTASAPLLPRPALREPPPSPRTT